MAFHPITASLRSWLSEVSASRVASGSSQEVVARTTGLSQAFISGVETGSAYRGETVSTETVRKLRILSGAIKHPLPIGFTDDGSLSVVEKRGYKPRAVEPKTGRRKPKAGGRGVRPKALLSLVIQLRKDGALTDDGAMRLVALANGG
jgi:transcriptional regulator with XRE-family HTH domain